MTLICILQDVCYCVTLTCSCKTHAHIINCQLYLSFCHNKLACCCPYRIATQVLSSEPIKYKASVKRFWSFFFFFQALPNGDSKSCASCMIMASISIACIWQNTVNHHFLTLHNTGLQLQLYKWNSTRSLVRIVARTCTANVSSLWCLERSSLAPGKWNWKINIDDLLIMIGFLEATHHFV